jgi:magnesium transporter
MNNWNFEYHYYNVVDLEMINLLESKFQVNPLDIEDILTDTQLSKFEFRENYLFVALQFPRYKKANKTVSEKELFFIINNDSLFVINKHDCKTMSRFNSIAHNILNKNIAPIDFFYEALDFMVTSSYRFIPKFKEELSIIEKDIFSNINKDHIHDIQLAKRNLINFNSIIIPLQNTLYDIQSRKENVNLIKFNNLNHIEKLDDSLDKTRKMISMINNYKEQVDMLSESNEALTARSTNQIIKTLTAFSMIILVPNIITSFFGMNIYFGWGSENNFWQLIIILASILISIIITWYILKKKDWL